MKRAHLTLVLGPLLMIHATPIAAQVPPPPGTVVFGSAPVVDEGLIRIDSTKTLELCDCTGRRVTLPVSLKAGPSPVLADGERPDVTEVVRGSSRIASNDFTLTWVRHEQKLTALTLAVADTLREPGSYSLVVSLFPRSNPTEPLEKLQVILPAAKIEVPDKIEVRRTVYWPWGTPWMDETKSPLIVRETGRTVDIRSLGAHSMPMSAGIHVVTGSIHVTPGTIGRDRTVPLTYNAEGDFPLGTTSGALLLRANELLEPAKIVVDVRSRLSAVYLFLTILIALVTSWLIKVKLARHIQLLQVRALSERLLGMTAVDRVRYQEPEFSDAIAASERELKLVFPSRQSEDIDAARTKLDGAWRAAVQAAEARRTDFRARAQSFDDLVTLDWALPPVLRTSLDDARDHSTHVSGKGPTPDLRVSLRALQDAQQALGAAIQHDGARWQQQSRAEIQRIVDTRDGLPDALVAAISAQLQTFAERFPIPDPQPRRFDTSTLEPPLRSVAGQYLTVRDLLSVAARRLDRTLEDVMARIPGANDTTLAQVASSIARVTSLLVSVADDPDESTPVIAALRDLQKTWEDELGALASAANADVVKQLARARKFEEAAESLSTPSVALERAIQTSVPARPTASVRPFSALLLPATSSRLSLPVFAAGLGAPFVAVFQSSLRSLRIAKGVQTLAMGALFVLSTLTTQIASWDGTWRGLGTVFFGAIAIDVTMDALINRLKSPS